MEINNNIYDRRKFLKNSIITGSITGIAGISLLSGCSENSKEQISPAEDLMRDHGVLNRIMLIYDKLQEKLNHGEDFPLSTLAASCGIIRSFIEDYHERIEEDFLFTRFEKANKLKDLVTTLRRQHMAGRILTDQITPISKLKTLSADDAQALKNLLYEFNRMYRPHESREDTVLFPELRKIISRNEFDSLCEDFQKKENELFGSDGFESIVEKVATIEKQLDIYDMEKFIPAF